jgi:hypothetical protein
MPKKTLIITAIIVAVIALGTTAVYITQRQGGGEVRVNQVEEDGALRHILEIEKEKELKKSKYFVEGRALVRYDQRAFDTFIDQLRKQFDITTEVLESMPPILQVYTRDFATCEKIRELLKAARLFDIERITECKRRL